VNDSLPVASVLIIDDERDIRDGCERILTRMGCAMAKAQDGPSGLTTLAQDPPDIVLLDLKMPGMDGLEVLARIKQTHPQVLVIVITGFATVETAIEAMKLGAYDFIPKPFQPDQLRLTVARAIERQRLTRETERLEVARRRTLNDLDTEKSRLRAIIGILPLGVAVTRDDGQVVLVNPAFGQLAGLSREALPGRPLADYLPANVARDLSRQMASPSLNDESDPEPLEFQSPDQRFIQVQSTRIVGEDGQGVGAVLVLVDVTAYRALDQLRAEFVAKVSHELRSPLSTILLQLSLLLGEEGTPKPQGRHLLERAKERTQGLISFVRDLMDLTRLENGAVRQEPRPIHLEEMFQQVLDSLSTQAEARGHQLILDLPPASLPCIVADPVGLESVFNNLLANAVNYSDDGGKITIRARQDGPKLRVEVIDQGFGIEPEKISLIFDKFYRVKNARTRYVTGTGLGLPIVKSVVESLGGHITVQSQPGAGSTFIVELPLGE
jgi:PAS domain S-box-containing protein